MVQINATDEDYGLNGMVQFRVVDSDDAFYVDDVTGRVVTSRR